MKQLRQELGIGEQHQWFGSLGPEVAKLDADPVGLQARRLHVGANHGRRAESHVATARRLQ